MYIVKASAVERVIYNDHHIQDRTPKQTKNSHEIVTPMTFIDRKKCEQDIL